MVRGREHLADVARHSPLESVHALDIEEIRAPEVTVWTAWEASGLLRCDALKQLDPHHGEIKSTRTAEAHLWQGVGARNLDHLIEEARRRSYQRLSLETGSMDAFAARPQALRTLRLRGMPPFADYRLDPYSAYTTLRLWEQKTGPPEPSARFAVRFRSHERRSPEPC